MAEMLRKGKAAARLLLLLALASAPGAPAVAGTARPLPSWNDGPARQAVLAFVKKVTTPGSPDFVPPAERLATRRGRRAGPSWT